MFQASIDLDNTTTTRIQACGFTYLGETYRFPTVKVGHFVYLGMLQHAQRRRIEVKNLGFFQIF